MEILLSDLKLAWRTLLKKPGFTFVAVITLALGIGANTAIFSAVNAVLLRPLPYPNPERLVRVFDAFPDFPRDGLTELEYDTLRSASTKFSGIAISNATSFIWNRGGEPERVQAALVSSNYLDLLGEGVALGRGFAHDEDESGKSNVAILSHDFWARGFGADPGVVGQTIALGGSNYTIIGVLAQGPKSPIEMQFATAVDLWTGYGFARSKLNRGSHGLSAIARLVDGVTLEEAQAETRSIIARVKNENAGFYPSDDSFHSFLMSLHEATVGDVRTALLVLLGAVATVLLIACANVASLLLARGESRRREIAVRTALGASRRRLIRQLLTESLLLAAAGGGVALLVGRWGLDALIAVSPGNIPRLDEVNLDVQVLLVTFGISLFAGLVFGLVPAVQATRPDLHTTLKDGGRGTTAGHGRLRKSLVVAETALALTLLIGGGLLLRSFWRLENVPMGFNPVNVLTMRLSPSSRSYRDNEQVANLYDRLIARIESLPGVRSVAVSDRIPISGSNRDTIMEIEGRPFDPAEAVRYNTDFRAVSPGYLRTMGARLVAGRFFEEGDREGSPNVTVINETLARRQWPNEDPIGRRLRLLDAPPEHATSSYMTVVGVVEDARNRTLAGETRQDVYVPLRQESASIPGLGPAVSLALIVRTEKEASTLSNAIRQEISAMDRTIPITQVRTMEQLVESAVVQPRFNMILLATFAIVALTLGAVGIYGVTAYTVAERTHEIGIRVALGARQADVLRMIVGQTIKLALAGVFIGLLLSLALTRLMSTLLFGVSSTDPITFAAVSVLLTGVALAASFVPARRATRVDPMVALRYE